MAPLPRLPHPLGGWAEGGLGGWRQVLGQGSQLLPPPLPLGALRGGWESGPRNIFWIQEYLGLSWAAELSFKRVWKLEPRVLREAAGGLRQPLCLALGQILGGDPVSRDWPLRWALAHIFLGTLLLPSSFFPGTTAPSQIGLGLKVPKKEVEKVHPPCPPNLLPNPAPFSILSSFLFLPFTLFLFSPV